MYLCVTYVWNWNRNEAKRILNYSLVFSPRTPLGYNCAFHAHAHICTKQQPRLQQLSASPAPSNRNLRARRLDC